MRVAHHFFDLHNFYKPKIPIILMAKNLAGKVRTLSKEKVRGFNERVRRNLFENKGSFLGTNKCKCGGKVIYGCKRSYGAELGGCEKCEALYIDYNGSRLPSVYDSKFIF